MRTTILHVVGESKIESGEEKGMKKMKTCSRVNGVLSSAYDVDAHADADK